MKFMKCKNKIILYRVCFKECDVLNSFLDVIKFYFRKNAHTVMLDMLLSPHAERQGVHVQ
jgi:hypothetical protein